MSEKEGLSDHDLDRLADKLMARLLPRLKQIAGQSGRETIYIDRVDINAMPASLRGGHAEL